MGRPRAFDETQALDRALRVFWSYGYDGATLPHLTQAMGINRPSLYAAFGNKEALFRQALERYNEGPGANLVVALNEPTARAVAVRLFNGVIDLLTNPQNPGGCLWVKGVIGCEPSNHALRQEFAEQRAMGEALLRRRFERAQAEGDLPPEADPGGLAALVNTVLVGMAVQTAAGAGREDLERAVDCALRLWPE